MNLFKKWNKMLSDESVSKSVWDKYLAKETDFYVAILSSYSGDVDGECTLEVKTSVADLVKKYRVDKVQAIGLLDGINESLTEELDLEAIANEIEELSEKAEGDEKDAALSKEIVFTVDFRKLYTNMIKVKADWLSSLDEWESVLSPKTRQSLKTAFYEENRAKPQKEAGRNEPCPCGSGKKYKKCCGKA